MQIKNIRSLMGLFILVVILQGCSTSRLPSSIDAPKLEIIKNLKFDKVIGVEKYMYPAYSEKLKTVLKDLNVFNDVVYSDSGSPYDLLARVDKEVSGTPVIPILTIISFGLIPTTVKESYGVIFSLNDNEKNTKIVIDAAYYDDAVMGWMALPMKFSPKYSFRDSPESSVRYRNYLKYKLYIYSESITNTKNK